VLDFSLLEHLEVIVLLGGALQLRVCEAKSLLMTAVKPHAPASTTIAIAHLRGSPMQRPFQILFTTVYHFLKLKLDGTVR
jgi:hypothetical protein